MKAIKFIFQYIYDTIYWFFSDTERLFNKIFKTGSFKPELQWSIKWECGCSGQWSCCPNWNKKCNLHNKKVIDIKAHTSWSNAWDYLYNK